MMCITENQNSLLISVIKKCQELRLTPGWRTNHASRKNERPIHVSRKYPLPLGLDFGTRIEPCTCWTVVAWQWYPMGGVQADSNLPPHHTNEHRCLEPEHRVKIPKLLRKGSSMYFNCEQFRTEYFIWAISFKRWAIFIDYHHIIHHIIHQLFICSEKCNLNFKFSISTLKCQHLLSKWPSIFRHLSPWGYHTALPG